MPGDFNENGAVDTADYVAWRKNDGQPETYAVWRANYGRTAGGGSVADAAVPEPPSVWLVLGASVPGWIRWRKWKLDFSCKFV